MGVILLLTGISWNTFGQEALVTATVDKNRILLGEPVLLTLEIRAPKGSNIAPFKIDSIPNFEFLQKDSLLKEEVGGALVIKQYFTITSFDSGRWVIPPFVLRPNVRTPSILMDVVFTEGFNPGQPYHDIQDVYEVPFKLGKTFEKWWYAIAALLVLLVLLIYRATTDKQPKVAAKVYKNAYAKAKEKFTELEQSGVKGYQLHTRLVEIFRTFVSERARVNSLHQTSGDLAEKLRPFFDKEPGAYKKLSDVLSLNDLVKFAQYNPDEGELGNAKEVVYFSVDHIETYVRSKIHQQQGGQTVTKNKEPEEK